MADYGGQNIFGMSVTILVEPEPAERQFNAFYGLSGVLSLWGGLRGRVFAIEGVLVGTDAYSLAAARDLFTSFDDGIARTLTDTMGVTWPSVIFERFQPTGRVVQLAGGAGLAMHYRAAFRGLQ